MMQNKLDAFFQKGPPQEPLRGNPANRLQSEKKEHSLGFVVVWTGFVQARLFLPVHLLELHWRFYPTVLDWKCEMSSFKKCQAFMHILRNRSLGPSKYYFLQTALCWTCCLHEKAVESQAKSIIGTKLLEYTAFNHDRHSVQVCQCLFKCISFI